ncbi:MAG: bifunctional precorrin-2 dehydrogenase/sirohydrochlorin ferrochelatase [Desulfovibrionaceae bacterium]|nr:bifunctional precorrin-2 dehydrogenase/sirohydrochlorin ferrochelatase [Desulfovibrionaceae bacterium]
MRYYPIFLNLRGKRCLVVGAGRVGRRKIAGLLECDPAEVLVLDPNLPSAEVSALPGHPALRHERRAFTAPDVAGRHLVFAATPVRSVNALVAACCHEQGVPCNVADAAQDSDFLVPARVDSGSLTLAVSTGGASPALARALREDLEKWLGRRYCRLACLLDKLRPVIMALHLGSDADAEIFRALCAMPLRETLAEMLNRADFSQARAELSRILPSATHPFLAELLHELD